MIIFKTTLSIKKHKKSKSPEMICISIPYEIKCCTISSQMKRIFDAKIEELAKIVDGTGAQCSEENNNKTDTCT